MLYCIVIAWKEEKFGNRISVSEKRSRNKVQTNGTKNKIINGFELLKG